MKAYLKLNFVPKLLEHAEYFNERRALILVVSPTKLHYLKPGMNFWINCLGVEFSSIPNLQGIRTVDWFRWSAAVLDMRENLEEVSKTLKCVLGLQQSMGLPECCPYENMASAQVQQSRT